MGELFKILPWFRQSRPIWLGFVVAFIGIAASFVGYAHLRLSDHQRAYETLERLADRRLAAIESTVRAYSDYLAAFQLLFRHSDDVSIEEFRAASRTTLSKYPGLDGLEWAEHIPADELPALAERLAGMGLPPLVLKALGPAGTPVPTTPAQSTVLPIIYTAPPGAYPAIYGFDLLSTNTPGPEINYVQRTGHMFMSRTTRRLLDMPDPGFVVYVPVFDSPTETETETVADLELTGVLIGVFRLEGFFKAMAETLGTEIDSIIIHDETTRRPDRLSVRVKNAGTFTPLAPGEMEAVNPELPRRYLSIWGRTWLLIFEPGADWLAVTNDYRSEQLLIFGILISGALGQMILVRGRRLAAVEAQVKERTAELQRSQQVLASIVNYNPAAIWLKDADGRFRLVNPEFCKIYNRKAEELIGQTDQKLYPNDISRFMEDQDHNVIAHAQSVAFEGTYNIAGEDHVYVVTKFPLIDAEGKAFALAGIATDITSLRTVEREQRAIERKLLEAQKLESLGVMAGGIAHDFNNLLTGVLGNADLISLDLPADHPTRPRLQSISQAARRAAELCQQLLAYTGRGHFREEPINISDLVRATVSLLELSVSKSARLNFDLAERPPRVLVDPTQMRQIIMNLVINASDALPETGGDITLRTGDLMADAELLASAVFGAPHGPGHYVFLEVADSGSGMSPDTLARIFDPFFSTKFTGRGLGLAAVSGIVRGHRGALIVTSELGSGTTFRLLLPVAPAPSALNGQTTPSSDSRSPIKPADQASSPPWGKSPRALVADDEPAVLEFAKAVMEAEGFVVVSATDGLLAVNAFDAQPDGFDLVILDLTMPRMGGAKVLEHIRHKRPAQPVLLMSGYSQTGETRVGGQDAYTSFLGKPFDGNTLITTVKAFMRSLPS